MDAQMKARLDHYLTTPLDDGYDAFSELVYEAFDDDFWLEHENWIDEWNGKCNDWISGLFYKEKDPEQAANIIQRAYKTYYNPQNAVQ